MGKRGKTCAKCGIKSQNDTSVTFHRFPLPAVNGSLKAKVWAKYCFPNEDWTEDRSLRLLNTSHKMICSNHFDDSSFTSSERKRLNNFAIPTEACGILAQLRDQQLHRDVMASEPSAPGCSTSIPHLKKYNSSIQFIESLKTESETNQFDSSSSTMAIVEDEVRNESEEDNEIEVVVEEFDGEEQDSDDSEDDDDAVDAALERKVVELEMLIKVDPYVYDHHIELVKALWALSDLDRWRAAFDNVIGLMRLKPEDWLLRLHTETTLSHSPEARERIAKLFEMALEDGFSLEILSDWCKWSVGDDNSPATARQQLRAILHCAGGDPLSGKRYWDTLFEYEKAQLDEFDDSDLDAPEFRKQKELICRGLEELVSRPLMQVERAWELYDEYVKDTPTYDVNLVERTRKRHEMALEFLEKITPFEDRLLGLENNTEEKTRVYEEYLEEAVRLFATGKYEPFYEATIKAIYDRATTECPSLHLLLKFAGHARAEHSAGTYRRTLRACARRQPRTHHFWTLMMQQAERENKDVAEVHASFEAALLRGMETYKEGEQLWLSYIEYKRRQTDFSVADDVDRLRSTFRLAWDSLATCYGEEANDCEVPLYWARVEYQRMKSPKEGREVFDEIFKYGDNKTMSKYWESLLRLEMGRSPPLAEHKLRELFRRALRQVADYPPAVASLWMDYERDFGTLENLVECKEASEKKIKEWREYYKTMKENMTGKKNIPKYKDNKKGKFDKNKPQDTKKQFDKKQTLSNPINTEQSHNKIQSNDDSKSKGKRKLDPVVCSSEVKRKREDMDVDEPVQSSSNGQGVKRSHSDGEEIDTKKQKIEIEDARSVHREACTLFVSNLEFKVNEQNLRNHLSQYGDIVSLRMKSGVKAFGGSICYCQYKNIESVDEALKHDRSPLDGRPMFFSRYTAKKTKPQFKYATPQEMNKLFVKNLPFANCNKDELTAIFQPHGKLNDVRIVTTKDGKPRGLAYIDYEDEDAAARAIEATNGMLLGERKIEVAISAPPPKAAPAAASLGLPKRDAGGGMRRTQLSSFIPSVLQKPVASTSTVNSDSEEKDKPKSNSDFRSLLLRKNQ